MKWLMDFYFVRIGNWGEILRCRTSPGAIYVRGTRVICRTPRGLEVGVVTAAVRPPADDPAAAAGFAEAATILRRTTTEDELLLARLEKHRCEAVAECRRCLAEAGSDAVLLEVDQLFDAGTLIFYFLAPPAAEDQALVERLAASYEAKVRSTHFAKLLAAGCGPGCGTKECGSEGEKSSAVRGRSGCSGSCAVCVVAGRPARS